MFVPLVEFSQAEIKELRSKIAEAKKHMDYNFQMYEYCMKEKDLKLANEFRCMVNEYSNEFLGYSKILNKIYTILN